MGDSAATAAKGKAANRILEGSLLGPFCRGSWGGLFFFGGGFSRLGGRCAGGRGGSVAFPGGGALGLCRRAAGSASATSRGLAGKGNGFGSSVVMADAFSLPARACALRGARGVVSRRVVCSLFFVRNAVHPLTHDTARRNYTTILYCTVLRSLVAYGLSPRGVLRRRTVFCFCTAARVATASEK